MLHSIFANSLQRIIWEKIRQDVCVGRDLPPFSSFSHSWMWT